nr:MAG TPA: chromosome partition protein [Caudoviricetes sp.]
MKTIKIKSLELLNFKGIRDLKIGFSDGVTNISGKNGSGKTTIFDAFTYVLFGKDSKDRKDFNIKTLDGNGKPIAKLPHEVKATIVVDGETIELQRRYLEKWTKRRGSAVEEFTGHEEERYYNGVPCSVKEYSEKVANICSEDVFKFITNPLYFTAQKTDIQRAMLFRMAGGVSDEDIARGDKDFENLLACLTGKTLEEYKREIQAKKKRIKLSIDGIPARIDERKRDMPEEEDWTSIEAQKKEYQKQLDNLDAQLADVAKQMQEAGKAQQALVEKLSQVRRDKINRRTELEKKLLNDHQVKLAEQESAKRKLGDVKHKLYDFTHKLQVANADVAELQNKRNDLLAEWRAINAETLTFTENDFTCPTCGRPLEPEDIQRRQNDMMVKFNANKAEKLEINKIKGLDVKRKIEDLSEQLESLAKLTEEYSQKYRDIAQDPILSQEITIPETEPVVLKDEQFIKLTDEEMRLNEQLQQELPAFDTTDIKVQKTAISERIAELDKRLANEDIIERNNERIASLEEELRVQSQELATFEGVEYIITKFNKAKVDAIEGKINAMFDVVKFKMFDTQINGGEIETCEAMVDGVPYSDLNTASKINAGLDIINAICGFEGVNAPIFVDNAESINALQHTDSQIVRLIVTTENKLTITNN